ncbi:hypothetical protein ILUMI_02787 [Ignelater luminosus]|uniref:Citramalyl-CoA lyase, mitochondrial n=1 Tax=Ignelater luminosus TaxID=2038154 RepID=A0A8K0DFV9_IGNLU|nr:hypothetical protein ILUMI_02787 [Ignelater luminosus]
MFISKIFKHMPHTNSKFWHFTNKISVRNYTPRRALMYVPGDDTRKLKKAWTLNVDCVAMDCEDGVAINRKETARETIRNILNEGKPTKKKFDWAVRVNSIDSGLCDDDLRALLTAEHLPNTVLLPKVENKEHILWFSERINSYIENKKKVELIIFIESAVAMINLPDICRTAVLLSKTSKFVPCALVFGSDDFCASIGATRTEDSKEILYARQKLVLVAKAFGLQAIDMVYIAYKDLEGLKLQSEEGSRMGYTGKQVIHPDQVPIVQEAFLPNTKQIEWAVGLLNAFKEHQKKWKRSIYLQRKHDRYANYEASTKCDRFNYVIKKLMYTLYIMLHN